MLDYKSLTKINSKAMQFLRYQDRFRSRNYIRLLLFVVCFIELFFCVFPFSLYSLYPSVRLVPFRVLLGFGFFWSVDWIKGKESLVLLTILNGYHQITLKFISFLIGVLCFKHGIVKTEFNSDSMLWLNAFT